MPISTVPLSKMCIRDSDGGFLLEYIPAGVTIGDQVDDQGQVVFKDTSDAVSYTHLPRQITY